MPADYRIICAGSRRIDGNKGPITTIFLQADALEEHFASWIGAEIIEIRLSFEINYAFSMLFAGLCHPFKGVVGIVETGVNYRHSTWVELDFFLRASSSHQESFVLPSCRLTSHKRVRVRLSLNLPVKFRLPSDIQ